MSPPSLQPFNVHPAILTKHHVGMVGNRTSVVQRPHLWLLEHGLGSGKTGSDEN